MWFFCVLWVPPGDCLKLCRGQGWIRLDVAPELLREGQRLQLHAFGRSAAIDEMETQAARLAKIHRAKGVEPAGALMVSCLDRGEQLYGEEGVAARPVCLVTPAELSALADQQVDTVTELIDRGVDAVGNE